MGVSKFKKHIPVEVLHEIFTADFNAGVLYWKNGKVAGFKHGEGYRMVCVRQDGKRVGMLVHRIIWAMKYGYWPELTIDHIDLDRTNNSIGNLRLATYSQNNVNRNAIRNGLKGATFDKRTGRYVAQINVNGRNKFIGRFDSELSAHSAYNAACKEIYGEFWRGP